MVDNGTTPIVIPTCGTNANGKTFTGASAIPTADFCDGDDNTTRPDPITTSGSKINWSCGGASCLANVASVTQPCATAPDITLSNGQIWKACNVGASVVGTGTDSIGTYLSGATALTACPSGYRVPEYSDWN